MQRNYDILDVMRIQTIVNVLMNEACWNYVAQPSRIDDIIRKLSDSLAGLRRIAGDEIRACPEKYCPEKGRCVPCTLVKGRLASLRAESEAPRGSAIVQARSTRRMKRKSIAAGGQARARSR